MQLLSVGLFGKCQVFGLRIGFVFKRDQKVLDRGFAFFGNLEHWIPSLSVELSFSLALLKSLRERTAAGCDPGHTGPARPRAARRTFLSTRAL